MGRKRPFRKLKFALNNEFSVAGQSLLLLAHADGMQVGEAECRFTRSYLWFDVGARRN